MAFGGPGNTTAMESQTQTVSPEAAAFKFLPLAPATSSSYPRAPNPEIKRRSSSLSSNGTQGKSSAGLRILKLGPVHDGEHLGEDKGDWHEVAVE